MAERRIPEAIDLVIIGGGPAGLSTALFLHQIDPGWKDRLVIFEKRAHPRHKLCAGGVTRIGLNLLAELGLHLDIPHVPVRQVRLEYRNQHASLYGNPLFSVTQRQVFDAWLADRVRERGLRLIEDAPVQKVSRSQDGLIVSTSIGTIRAKAAVSAEGSKRGLRRWLSLPAGNSLVARTLELIVPAQDHERLFTEKMARFLLDETQNDLQGYAWAFPSLHGKAERLNIGVYDARTAPGRARARLVPILRRTMEAFLGECTFDAQWRGHPIHLFSPGNPISAPRVLLVGDAAGVDPLLGEGISVAMGYGKVAAETLQRSYENGDFGFRSYRRRVLFSPLGKYLILRWLAARVVYRWSGSRRLMSGFWGLIRFLTWLTRLDLSLGAAD
jgi:flavin-dependent dehydrogenase